MQTKRFARPFLLTICFLYLSFLSGGDSARGQGTTHRWTNDSGGLFSDAGNWLTDVPGVDDTALFDSDQAYNVDLDVVQNIRLLSQIAGVVSFADGTLNTGGVVLRQNATMRLPGQTSRFNLIGGRLQVGGTARLLLNDAALLSGDAGATIGQGPGNSFVGVFDSRMSITGGTDVGDATISVVGSGRLTTDILSLGRFGTRSLLSVSGDDARLDNSGSTFIGRFTQGDLQVTAGATATTNATSIGLQSGSVGSVTVSGAGSTLGTSSLVVGAGGSGTMTVASGGVVSSTLLSSIGSVGSGIPGTGVVTVEGSGSRWDIDDDLQIGSAGGQGTLNITDSGVVAVSGFTQVSDISSIVLNDASFSSQLGLVNRGTISVTGGTANISGTVGITDSGRVATSGNASTIFHDGVTYNAVEIATESGSSTIFASSFEGAGSSTGVDFTGTGEVVFQGEVRPGNSPALLDFEGDVMLASTSTSFIEIAGLELSDFDRFDIAGDLDLGGALSVSLIDGFTLGLGQEFLFADIEGAVTGQFIGLGEGGLVGTYGGTDLRISYARGSGNDIALFTAVPEPGSLGLIALVAVVSTSRRRRA